MTATKSAVKDIRVTASEPTRVGGSTRVVVDIVGTITAQEHTEFAKDLADLVDLYFPTIKE